MMLPDGILYAVLMMLAAFLAGALGTIVTLCLMRRRHKNAADAISEQMEQGKRTARRIQRAAHAECAWKNMARDEQLYNGR